jgi:alanyl-tRNA synthetase
MVTEATPFYAESGGQVGDIGRVIGPAGEVAQVVGVVKDPTGLVIHRLQVQSGVIRKGDAVALEVDAAARFATALNHTATHLLHAALRRVLGEHVKQAGSLVGPDRLRFDFTHFAHIEPEALEAVEAIVNGKIRENILTQIEEMAAEDAFQSGAMALFEEKYGDRVRVISLADFSKELCGGTHTQRTGDIGVFKIVSESSVAAGVRRIEALTGAAALQFVQRAQRTLHEASRLVKESPEGLPARLAKLLADLRGLEREVEQLKGKLAAVSMAGTADEIREVAGVKALIKRVEADSPALLRDLLDRYKDRMKSGVVVLGSVHESKVMLIAGVTRDLVDRFHAGRIIQQAAAVVGGKGGGRPDMAQAGGSQPENLDQALSQALEVIRNG